MWEAIVKEYNGLVKFGRINEDNEASLLKKLPFASIYLPTVMSVGGNNNPEIL
jgi:hypothetical protein